MPLRSAWFVRSNLDIASTVTLLRRVFRHGDNNEQLLATETPCHGLYTLPIERLWTHLLPCCPVGEIQRGSLNRFLGSFFSSTRMRNDERILDGSGRRDFTDRVPRQDRNEIDTARRIICRCLKIGPDGSWPVGRNLIKFDPFSRGSNAGNRADRPQLRSYSICCVLLMIRSWTFLETICKVSLF